MHNGPQSSWLDGERKPALQDVQISHAVGIKGCRPQILSAKTTVMPFDAQTYALNSVAG